MKTQVLSSLPTAGHTAGPLSVWLCQSSGKPPRLEDRIGDRVCSFNDSHPRTKEFQALLSSAPAMLEALRGMVSRYSESPGSYTPEGAAARAVIAQAEGGK